MTNKEIKAELESQLNMGKVSVVIDTNHRSVKVPESFLNVGPTIFILAWDYPGIDIEINARSVKATLKFSGQSFRCIFPLKSIKTIMSASQSQAPPAAPKKKKDAKQSEGALKVIKKEFPVFGLGRRGTLTQLK